METAINIVGEQTIWKTKKSSKMDQSSKRCRKERKVGDKKTYWSSIPKGKPKLTDKLQRNQIFHQTQINNAITHMHD